MGGATQELSYLGSQSVAPIVILHHRPGNAANWPTVLAGMGASSARSCAAPHRTPSRADQTANAPKHPWRVGLLAKLNHVGRQRHVRPTLVQLFGRTAIKVSAVRRKIAGINTIA